MATQYVVVLTALLQQIDTFRRGDLSLDALKSAIWETARQLSSHEERALREALQQAEGRLDMIQFTVEDRIVRVEALKIVDTIETWVKAVVALP